MAADDKSNSKFPLSNVIVLAGALIGAFWLYQGPLTSSRPVDGAPTRVEQFGDRRVQARLWQDPFDAVERHQEAEARERKDDVLSAHAHSLDLLAGELTPEGSPVEHLTLLLTISDGSPYAEGVEARLRQRFALLAGLEQSGYVPTDGEHMRFFQWDGAAGIGRLANPCATASGQGTFHDWCAAVVPVEWYQHEQGGRRYVALLWVKDQDLGPQPLGSLQAMRDELLSVMEPRAKAVAFRVIGPRFSGTLSAIVHDAIDATSATSADGLADTAPRSGQQQPDAPLILVSPWSTAPEYQIYPHDESSQSTQSFESRSPSRHEPVSERAEASRIAKLLDPSGVTLVRAIQTDDRLIEALVDELRRRGVRLAQDCSVEWPCDRVALVSEWDTLYGRSLPKIFSQEATRPARATQSTEVSDPGELNQPSERTHRFSYLRGLDGELPRAKGNEGGGATAGQASGPASLSDQRRRGEQLERAEGPSQLDYVRRLAQVMKDEEETSRADCGVWRSQCTGFRAIGVLGSDVYDKLLILQALKQQFPHAIFFTTDLDARLFHSRELPWTRNLVVASHFGLALNDRLQGVIPPFRDAYQTSTFYAVMRALDQLEISDACRNGAQVAELEVWDGPFTFTGPASSQPSCFHLERRPRLFEIGRDGPVDLSLDPVAAGATRLSAGDTTGSVSVHAVRSAPFSPVRLASYVMAGFVLVLLSWLLLLRASERVYRLTRDLCLAVQERPGRTAVLVLTFLGLAAGVLGVGMPWLVSDGPKGEPFTFDQGVSIWPSQILRGAVVLLSAVCIWRIRRAHAQASRELEQEFASLLTPAPVAQGGDRARNQERVPQTALGRMGTWCRLIPRRSVSGWMLFEDLQEPPTLWQEYRQRLDLVRQGRRVLTGALLFLLTGVFVFLVTDRPFVPFRGDVARFVNWGVLMMAVVSMVIVMFLVLDVMHLTSVFVRKLVAATLCPIQRADYVTKLQLVAKLTARIDGFSYYPAVLLALMLLARAEYFDNWDFPIGLAVVMGVSAVYVVVSALYLRRASDAARRFVLQELAGQRLAGEAAGPSATTNLLVEQVQAIRDGAFRPYTEHPVFRAFALPSGAYGLFAIIEFLINTS